MTQLHPGDYVTHKNCPEYGTGVIAEAPYKDNNRSYVRVSWPEYSGFYRTPEHNVEFLERTTVTHEMTAADFEVGDKVRRTYDTALGVSAVGLVRAVHPTNNHVYVKFPENVLPHWLPAPTLRHVYKLPVTPPAPTEVEEIDDYDKGFEMARDTVNGFLDGQLIMANKNYLQYKAEKERITKAFDQAEGRLDALLDLRLDK